jgi:hypothetical protein
LLLSTSFNVDPISLGINGVFFLPPEITSKYIFVHTRNSCSWSRGAKNSKNLGNCLKQNREKIGLKKIK